MNRLNNNGEYTFQVFLLLKYLVFPFLLIHTGNRFKSKELVL